ncbi:MAG: alpha/beta hydrolase [Planctomycetaceae bacterium]|nr:MAG: alpha/beta hydrolase [Planctomycetaceae bacterium]
METHTDQNTKSQDVEIRIADVTLHGTLAIPDQARSIVLFAHGAGSSRFSPRNQYVAHILQGAGLATLLMDLMTEREERSDAITRTLAFDIPFLAERVEAATDWVLSNEATRNLRIGYFGASTGAGAALMAAAHKPDVVGAVVSRGGRPDLAAEVLPEVKAPTLLIVGGWDTPVIEMNREAAALLQVENKLVIIPGATHLFEEPGTLDEVADYASQWFTQYLTA